MRVNSLLNYLLNKTRPNRKRTNKMKIRYSPHYDAEIFVRNESNLMDVIYVGTQKLLEQLELRAAMSQDAAPS